MKNKGSLLEIKRGRENIPLDMSRDRSGKSPPPVEAHLKPVIIGGHILRIAEVDGLQLFNGCNHHFIFRVKAGKLVKVPPSGFRIEVKRTWTVREKRLINGREIGFCLHQVSPKEEVEKLLRELRARFPELIILGSIYAAQAYTSMKVVAPIPTRETMNRPPFKRVYVLSRFHLPI